MSSATPDSRKDCRGLMLQDKAPAHWVPRRWLLATQNQHAAGVRELVWAHRTRVCAVGLPSALVMPVPCTVWPPGWPQLPLSSHSQAFSQLWPATCLSCKSASLRVFSWGQPRPPAAFFPVLPAPPASAGLSHSRSSPCKSIHFPYCIQSELYQCSSRWASPAQEPPTSAQSQTLRRHPRIAASLPEICSHTPNTSSSFSVPSPAPGTWLLWVTYLALLAHRSRADQDAVITLNSVGLFLCLLWASLL